MLYVIAGVLGGVLIALIVLGRAQRRPRIRRSPGNPVPSGAVLKSGLRRSWTGSEMPINVSPRTQDAVYRAVGRGGVVLIGEGPRTRTQPMLDKERANVQRVLPNVPVNLLYVGPDAGSTALHKIVPALQKLKRVLTKAEVQAVSNRLASLGREGLPIPKGIDPNRVRAPRPARPLAVPAQRRPRRDQGRDHARVVVGYRHPAEGDQCAPAIVHVAALRPHERTVPFRHLIGREASRERATVVTDGEARVSPNRQGSNRSSALCGKSSRRGGS